MAAAAPPLAVVVAVWAAAVLPDPASADEVLADGVSADRNSAGSADLVSVVPVLVAKVLAVQEWALAGKVSAAVAALVSVLEDPALVAKRLDVQAWVATAGKVSKVAVATAAHAWVVRVMVVAGPEWVVPVMAGMRSAVAVCIVTGWVVAIGGGVEARPPVDVVIGAPVPVPLGRAVVGGAKARKVGVRKLAARGATVPVREVLATFNKAVSAASRVRAPKVPVALVRVVRKAPVPMSQVLVDSKAVVAGHKALVAGPLPSVMKMTTSDRE